MALDLNTLFPTLNTIEATGSIRSVASDFKVTELNDIEFANEGEHLWLYIEKTNSNTNWVAKQLSNICQVPQRQVGYAGLKDRNAVTKQWFSIQLPKIDDSEKIQAALPDEIIILSHNRHNKKIKKGQLDSNQFEIIIRHIDGDKNQIEDNVKNVCANGVPNYFGPQRFGHDMGNIPKAHDWFAGDYKVKSRNLKSLLISTARSHIFNCIIAHRIIDNTWDKPISGDIVALNNSRSWFPSKDTTPSEINQRLHEFDIHLTAAMWGEDRTQSSSDCALLETKIADEFPIYQKGFEKFRLKQDRRSMRLCPSDFRHEWIDDHMKLNFKLQPGSYATSIIREICLVTNGG